jgi:hypothetical protein
LVQIADKVAAALEVAGHLSKLESELAGHLLPPAFAVLADPMIRQHALDLSDSLKKLKDVS